MTDDPPIFAVRWTDPNGPAHIVWCRLPNADEEPSLTKKQKGKYLIPLDTVPPRILLWANQFRLCDDLHRNPDYWFPTGMGWRVGIHEVKALEAKYPRD